MVSHYLLWAIFVGIFLFKTLKNELILFIFTVLTSLLIYQYDTLMPNCKQLSTYCYLIYRLVLNFKLLLENQKMTSSNY